MWSSGSIAGTPRILLVDATRNSEGWEYAFSDRVFRSFQRSEFTLEGDAPQRVGNADSLSHFRFNSLLLFANAQTLPFFLQSLDSLELLSPFLLAICPCGNLDPDLSQRILEGNARYPFVIAPLSPMIEREAGLFYLKFFSELKLHSTENLSGKMVWFSFSKARELLRRRRYTAKFGIRC